MRRFGARRRLVAASVALLVVSASAATVLSADDSDEQRSKARAPRVSPQTPAPPRQRSPAPSTPAAVSPVAAGVRARAREFLTGYLAQLHGRGSLAALRHLAARGLLRELGRNRRRVTPMQERTRTRIVDLRAALRSPGSVRAVASVKEHGGPPYRLRLYLERRAARWIVTRIGDA